MRTVALAISALAAIGLLLAGCAGGSDSSDSADAGGDAAARSAGAVAPEAARDQSDALDSDTSTGSGADAPQDGVPGTDDTDDTTTLQQPAIISTGTVTISATDLDAVGHDLDKIIAAHRGHTTSEESSTDRDGEVEYAQRVIRVPSSDFAAVVREMKGVADQVEVQTDSQDVTTKVVDVDARVRAQERALQRMELLLDRAESLKDIISVESELTRRQADLDALKSQQAYLADQTSMSTLTIFLDRLTTAPAPKSEEDHNAFVGGLLGGWDALTRLGGALASVLGALLPFLVVLALFGAACWAALRVTRPARLRAEQRRRLARDRADQRQQAQAAQHAQAAQAAQAAQQVPSVPAGAGREPQSKE